MKTDNCQKICIETCKNDIRNNCFLPGTNFLRGNAIGQGEKWFIRNNLTNLFATINSLIPDHITSDLKQKIFLILNDLRDVPICRCGMQLKFEFFSRGYREYCSVKCRANDKAWQDNVKQTCIEKYDKNHVRQVKHINDRVIEKLRTNSSFVKFSSEKFKEMSRKAEETRKKKYNCNTGWLPHAIETRIKNGSMIDPELKPLYDRYKQLVKKYTNRSIKKYHIENVEKRNNHALDINAYHLDHKFSIKDGFTNAVPAYIIGHVVNIRCIPNKENLMKQKKSSISIDQLIEEYFSHEDV